MSVDQLKGGRIDKAALDKLGRTKVDTLSHRMYLYRNGRVLRGWWGVAPLFGKLAGKARQQAYLYHLWPSEPRHRSRRNTVLRVQQAELGDTAPGSRSKP